MLFQKLIIKRKKYMYKIIISEYVLDKIDNFMESYLNSFLSLFEDSWIDNVHLIEDNYIKISEELKIKIISWIKNTFKEKIIWKKIWENNELSVVILVGNYRLFIDFTENLEEKIRFIENIEFYKK